MGTSNTYMGHLTYIGSSYMAVRHKLTCSYLASDQAEHKGLLFIFNIYFFFINMGPYGSKNIKTLLSLHVQITSGIFQASPEILSE